MKYEAGRKVIMGITTGLSFMFPLEWATLYMGSVLSPKLLNEQIIFINFTIDIIDTTSRCVHDRDISSNLQLCRMQNTLPH
jgi:hypothetical protein